ncbi:NUDIX domain-containing protein [Paenibacillus kribbensis]|uniref:NUDIX hydrolase n=1 Tax=Paenibacillus kribbensis TaxID=172713 RepID=UPI002DB8EFA4|nr:NUDIX domain-containing protein [Paenibacillus kribbensis]MEC0236039.1 NUDIX domain-containing protein [Paenibacillus kribbensis]
MTERSKYNPNGLTEEQFLAAYDATQYERPSVTVDMLLFTVMDQLQHNYRKLPEKTLQLLLIQRGEHPFIGQWALPGGFVGMDESLEEAARRELKTETNVDQIYMEQLYTWGDVARDPRMRVISCAYMALVDHDSLEVQAGDDAADARWFELDYSVAQETRTNQPEGYTWEQEIDVTLKHGDIRLSAKVKVTEILKGKTIEIKREVLESQGIAFDHAKIIAYGIERLRSKIEYTDIAFHLMPSLFTLGELQQVYEIILGKELLAAAFRRKIADLVDETNEYRKAAGHRPSKLYRFKPRSRFI